jgi:hypothetical protein
MLLRSLSSMNIIMHAAAQQSELPFLYSLISSTFQIFVALVALHLAAVRRQELFAAHRQVLQALGPRPADIHFTTASGKTSACDPGRACCM